MPRSRRSRTVDRPGLENAIETRLAALPVAAVHAVDPTALHQVTIERVKAMVIGTMKPNTRRAIITALAYWAAWYRCRYGATLPLADGQAVSPASVLTFCTDHSCVPEAPDPAGRSPALHMSVVDHGQWAWIDQALVAGGFKARLGPLRWTTIRQRLQLLAAEHVRRGLPSPLADQAVKLVMRALRRQLGAHGLATTRHAFPLRREDMRRIVDSCDDSATGIRDRAILLMGWPRRRSEIALAKLQNLERRRRATGEVSFLYHLTDTKTQEPGESSAVPVQGSAALALDRWLSLLELHCFATTEGPIFRHVVRDAPTDRPLSDRYIARMLQARANAAGVAPTRGHISGHSLRRGFVSEGLGSMPIKAVQQMTQHKSIRTLLDVYAEVEPETNPAARLFDT